MFITDQGKRSELQEKISAELREKMAQQSNPEGEAKDLQETPDHVEDSAYIKDFEKSTPLSRAVVLVIVGAVVVAVGIVVVIITSWSAFG